MRTLQTAFRVLLPVIAVGVVVFATAASAQDLYVSWVTVNPNSGAAGDSVTVQARIGNNGPSWAIGIELQWYLSEDSTLTAADFALGGYEALFDYLNPGQELTLTRNFTMPPFNDPAAPSYIGLVLDPFEFLSDPSRANNSGVAAFTYTGIPPNSFFDPAGDNPIIDIVHVKAVAADGNLNLTVTFREPPTSIFSGLMAIDLDQDPATGAVDLTIPGAEAVADILYQQYAPMLTLKTAAGQYSLDTLALSGNTLTCSIPLSLLGNDTAMDIFWAFDHTAGASADFDRAPDVGAFATDTNQVVVRRPGDATIQVDIQDPVAGGSEPEFPNVSRLQAEVIGDQLQIILTYTHSVEDLQGYPSFDGLFAYVSVDADRRLCTGFRNTELRPPAFGIDHELRLQIDALAGVVPELLRDADGDGGPEVKPMGLPVNDMFMRLSGNRIILRIPLGYLGFSDGGGAIAVTNFNSRQLPSNVSDRVPDTGAWDLKTDQLLPGQGCSSIPVHVDDPNDDSVGGYGLDNDELTALDACLGNDALLLTIAYKSYALSNDGATLIFLDTDRNPATGEAHANMAGGTQIGVDYYLLTYWDTDLLKQITVLTRTGPAGRTDLKNQLTTVTLANRLYVTIPLECIGSPAGEVDLMLLTAAWAGAILLPYDDLPNLGVVTLPSRLCRADLDRDGDVDGADLAAYIANPGTLAPADFAAEFGRVNYP
jgi:hypothetical protein